MEPVDQEAYEKALQRWNDTNASLVIATGQPELMNRLSGVIPETLDGLTTQAGERALVETRLVEYNRAVNGYFKALGEPLSPEQHAQFLVGMPLESKEMAITLGYIHNMSPEIERYREAMVEQGVDNGSINEALSHIPKNLRDDESRDITESATFYSIHSDDAVEQFKDGLGNPGLAQDVNTGLSTAPVTPGSVAAQAYQVEQGVGVDQYPPKSLHGQDEPSSHDSDDGHASISLDEYDFSDPSSVSVGDPSMIAALQAQGIGMNAGISSSSAPAQTTNAPGLMVAPAALTLA